ncbi:FecR domain-containing protein [Hyunsoonleella sp. SJ7]|uniref:FecR domain-containing protein n=1 Tax=Hyunsoonleella aquatilis TaxID=2762758 RepID=A0A923HAW3_9FLAO|nr:FecR family protein [Hyunsoonleella aquatilis]MBC3757631.1 FecR domain-containing protein [Hyunsoonleella aquatilis]
MSKENDILKWFDGEISAEDIKARYPDEDFSTLEKTGFYTKQLEAPKVDTEKALADFKKKNFKKEVPKVIPLNFKSFLRVAAVVVALLTSSYFVFFNNTMSFSTEIAQTETFNLPDNSEVILNAHSKLSYNKKQWKTDRTLDLDGEAFFKVMKGEKFSVMTDAGVVQVLGTQFNVKERDNYFEVQCFEGSVSVTSGENEKILKPGNTFRMVNGKIIEVKDFNATRPSWLAQESTFDGVPLWQVIDELEHQYDINITVENIDTSVLYSGGFTHNDINVALQSVSIPLKLSYKINGKTVEFYDYESN